MLFPNQVKAEETTATTNEYTLSTDGTPIQAPLNTSYKSTDIFSFTVNTVSKIEVNISAKNTVWDSIDASAVSAGVFKDKYGTKVLYKCNFTEIPTNDSITFNTCVEPGTYYIVAFRNDSELSSTNGFVSASVNVLSEIKDERPISIEKSVTLKSGTTYNNLATVNGSRKFYYRFKLRKNATINIFSSAESSYPDLKQLPYKIIILNKNEVEKASNELTGVSKVEDSKFNLAKGTYYVCIDYSNTYYVGDISAKAIISYKK